MTENDYNGWKNKPTWLVNVWHEPVAKDDIMAAKEDLQAQIDAMPNGILRDLVGTAFASIDWQQLLDATDDTGDTE